MRRSVRVTALVLLVLLGIVCTIWYAVAREDRGGRLTVSFLAVGQGDAVFIDAPSGRQVLVDGGPDGSVLRALGSVMPPWDRSVDIVFATSADAGAVSGLVDVLQRYSVDLVVQTGVESSTPVWNLFEQEAAGKRIVTARRGQVLDLGGGAYIQILFPDRSVPGAANAEGCVVAKVVYGTTSFLLPCVASAGVQRYLTMLDGTKLHADALLMSPKQNISPIFAGYVAPTYIVAEGCTSATSTPNAQQLNTCDGTVTFVSDGKVVTRK